MKEVSINMVVAQNIEALMRLRDLDAAKLARKADLNPTGIYDIVKGKSRSPKIETIGKIAKALNVPVSVLFSADLSEGLKTEILDIYAQLPDDRRELLLQTAKSWLGESAA
jgi:transcriptional regulator with XRE-family HTH domain